MPRGLGLEGSAHRDEAAPQPASPSARSLGNSGSFGRNSGLESGVRGTIADTIASARASLKNPSRPFTPADPHRRLHAHPLLPSNVAPPATPLIDNERYEAERPFTGRLRTPLGSARSQGTAEDTPKQRGAAEVLTLDDPNEAESASSLPATTRPLSAQRDEPFKIQELLALLKPSTQVESLIETAEKLNALLPDTAAIRSLGTSQRSEIVRAVAKCLEVKEPILLAKLARIILKVTKGGPNLLSVSKLLFRLSKAQTNDKLLRDEGLCEQILGAMSSQRLESVLGYVVKGAEQCEAELDAIVFLSGSLKNCTTDNEENRVLLLREGAVETFSHWIQALTNFVGEKLEANELGERPVSRGRKEKFKEQICKILSQVTATMRNLAASSSHRGDFVTKNGIKGLLDVMDFWQEESELLLNASRVLSKLSLSKECLDFMCGMKELPLTLIRIMKTNVDNVPLMVRIFFVLGNLTASNEECRMSVATSDDSLEFVLQMLQNHSDNFMACEPGPAHHSQDLLVKLVRFVAHLAISADAGPMVAAKDQVRVLISMIDNVSIEHSEELLLNVVSAVTNLSYYEDPGSVIWENRFALAEGLAAMLFVPNEEAVLEAARAFGNLSRDPATRDVMHNTRVDEAMVLLLDHGQRDVLAAAAGVVVNLAGDAKCAGLMVDCDAVVLLVDALQRTGQEDADLSCTLCYAMFNLCAYLEWNLEGGVAVLLLQGMDELQEGLDAGASRGEDTTALKQVSDRLIKCLHEHCGDVMLAWEQQDKQPQNFLEPLDPPGEEP